MACSRSGNVRGMPSSSGQTLWHARPHQWSYGLGAGRPLWPAGLFICYGASQQPCARQLPVTVLEGSVEAYIATHAAYLHL